MTSPATATSIMRVDVLALVLTCLAALSGATSAAQPPDSQTGASRIALAAVTDPRNRPLVDVGADDFVIQEAGVTREVLSVRPADYPIALLLDTGSESRADFPLLQKAAAHFLERIGQRPIALGTFGGTATMLTTFEDERQTVMAKLGETAADPSAGSALMQGASLAARKIQETGTLFSCIVILSTTQDDASREAPDEMIAPVVDSNATLHVIANRPGQTVGRRSALEPRAPRAGRAVARRVHRDLLRRVVPGGARSPGRSSDERDDDRISRPGRIEAERREGGRADPGRPGSRARRRATIAITTSNAEPAEHAASHPRFLRFLRWPS